MPQGMLYAAHLAQGHFQDPPEADLGRDWAPHGDVLPCTNLSDIKQWVEEECKTYISLFAVQYHFFLADCVSPFVLCFLFISMLLQVYSFKARCKANCVNARYDLLSRSLRNKQTCVWNLHIWALYRCSGIHVSLHACTQTHIYYFSSWGLEVILGALKWTRLP